MSSTTGSPLLTYSEVATIDVVRKSGGSANLPVDTLKQEILNSVAGGEALPATAKTYMNYGARSQFDTDAAADPTLLNKVAGSYDGVLFECYHPTGPAISMTFEVTTSNPNASPSTTGDPTSRLLTAGVYLGQRYEKEIWAEQLGAMRDATTDDRAAAQAALRLSCHLKMTARFGEGIFRIVGPGSGAALDLPTIGGFEGTKLVGSGRRRTKFAFAPANQYQTLFQVSGGSGQLGNRVMEGFEAYSLTAGHAKLIEVIGACFLPLRDLYLHDAGLGVELNNSGAGQFNEFVEFNRVAIYTMAHSLIHFWRGDGTNSYHGVRFPDLFLHLNGAGPGIKFGGNRFSAAGNEASAAVYPYNVWGDIAVMWDGNATKKIIEGAAGLNAPSFNVNIHKESTGGGVGQIDIAAGGILISRGSIDSISDITAPGAGIVDFQGGNSRSRQERSLKGALTNLPNFNILPFGSLGNQDKATEKSAPTVFGMNGSNRGAVGIASFDPNANAENGLYVGHMPNGAQVTAKEMALGFFLRGDGALLEGRDNTSPFFAIRQRGQSTGLMLAGGRVGGHMGRDVSAVIPVATPNTYVDLFNMGNREFAGIAYLRLNNGVTDYRMFLIANHQGFGGTGFVTVLANWNVGGGAPGGYTSLADFILPANANIRVSTGGVLQVRLPTLAADVTARCGEFGLGFQNT